MCAEQTLVQGWQNAVTISIAGACIRLEEHLKHARRQLEQVERRLLKGEQIAQDEKVFSIFEPHTRWVAKGKAGCAVELGVPVCVVAAEFREGNESPNKKNLEFIQRCQSALPDGVSVSHVRIDAAGYQPAVINHAMDNGMGFAIHAKMDGTVKETISGIKDSDWRSLVYRDGRESDTEQVCRTLHVMTKRHRRLRWWCKESALMMMTTHSWIFSSTTMMKQWHGALHFSCDCDEFR